MKFIKTYEWWAAHAWGQTSAGLVVLRAKTDPRGCNGGIAGVTQPCYPTSLTAHLCNRKASWRGMFEEIFRGLKSIGAHGLGMLWH